MSQTEPDQEWSQPLPEVAGAEASREGRGGAVRHDPEPAARYGPVPPAPTPGGGGGGASTSTIILLVVSGVLLLMTFWTFVGVLWAGPAALAVVALTRASTDPAGAGRLTRIGWWVTAGLGVLGVLLVALLIVGILLLGRAATPSGYDSSTVGLVAALQTLVTTAAR